jgi:hypothetical protein
LEAHTATILRPDSRLRCPHCRDWHPVSHGHTDGTDYTLQMLYFTCRGLRYYAGQHGYPFDRGVPPLADDISRPEPARQGNAVCVTAEHDDLLRTETSGDLFQPLDDPASSQARIRAPLRVWVASKPGECATFSFTLPLAS